MFRQLRLDGVLLVLVLLLISPIAGANSALTGSWYNPDRDGEGFHIEILPDQQALVIWFTYPGPNDDPEAEQAWILGTGSVTDNTINIVDAFRTHGPVFGPGYEQDDLVIETWGNLTLTFSDNNNGVVDFSGTDGEGTTDIIRITSLANQEDSGRFPVGMSGAWYNPDTNGQGWFMEVLSDELALLYFFTYDKNGNQAWSLEAGYFDGNRVVVANTKSGKGTRFGDQFDQEKVQREAFVNIVMEYDGCDGGWARFETVDGAESDVVPIVRSTSLSSAECKNLVVVAREGGSIVTASGERDCYEGRTCLVNVLDESGLSETYTAVPRSGYVFKGWSQTSEGLCSHNEASCAPNVSSVENDATLGPVFEPEGNLYFPSRNSLAVCSYVTPVDSLMVDCETKDFESYGFGSLTDFKVTSDDIFYDVKRRKQELLTVPKGQREHMCNTWYGEEYLDYSTYTPTPPADEEPGSRAPEPGIWDPLKFGRVAYSLFDDQEAGKMILRSLLAWEEHEVDQNWVLANYGSSGEGHFQLGYLLPIYVLAWEAIREAEFVTVTDRQIIDKYLHELMEYLAQRPRQEQGVELGDSYTCDDPCLWANIEVFNHAWSQDLGLMTYGVITKNDTLYQRGIARFFGILDGLVREDGSHYYESQRGGQALAYSIIATTLMIRMAELAANQGHDLYNAEVNGISLHTLMEFHISVLEDESLIYQYTQYRNEAYCGPNSEVDVGCTNWNNQAASESWPHGHRFNESWQNFELYRKRFPASPLVDRYLAMYPDGKHDNASEGPLLQVCEFRHLGE